MAVAGRAAAPSVFAKASALAALAALAIGGWAVAAMWLPAYVLPSPAVVFVASVGFFRSWRLFGHFLASVEHVAASIALSFVLGSALAFAAHYARWTAPTIYNRFGPFLGAFPSVGWTLIAVIWFGVSPATVVFTVSAVLLPFAMINLREGLRALDREVEEMALSFTRRRTRIFVGVLVPALLPFAAATLRIMFGVAWKVVLTAELFGGNRGLGYLINLARQDFDTAIIFAAIALIILVVFAADRLAFAPLERITARRFGA